VVAVVATGGTIAGSLNSPERFGYRPAIRTIHELLDAVPGLEALAEVKHEQLFQMDSVNMDDKTMLALVRRTTELLATDEVDAVLVTQGTDTLEEMSYLAHLTVKSRKPVVFVASMRPGDDLSADGPRNLRNAVATAASGAAGNMGALVVMNDEIHTARDATKMHTLNVSALQSPHGPLGYVVDDRPIFYRLPSRQHTYQTTFDVQNVTELPRVDVIYAHAGMGTSVIEALVASGTSAIICAGMGNGHLPDRVYASLKAARSAGIHVVRASRSGSGPVVRNASAPDDENDWIVVDDQNPQKARLLMALALSTTQDTRVLQSIFWTY